MLAGCWNAVAWPSFCSRRECILSRLLGEIEVAEEADEGGQHLPPLVAEYLIEREETPVNRWKRKKTRGDPVGCGTSRGKQRRLDRTPPNEEKPESRQTREPPKTEVGRNLPLLPFLTDRTGPQRRSTIGVSVRVVKRTRALMKR